MRLEPLALLTALTACVAILAGGQIIGGGLSVSYDVLDARLYVSPHIMIAIEYPPPLAWGLTLGGASVVSSVSGYSQNWLLRYELQHVKGWQAYGLGYALEVIFNACDYDPLALWGRYAGCDPLSRAAPPPMRFAAFSIKL